MKIYVAADKLNKSSYYPVSVLLEMLEKSDYRRASRTDLPKPEVDPLSLPSPPKTLQELDNLLSSLDTQNLGKLVGQGLVSGNVDLKRSQILLSHLVQLVAVSESIRQTLKKALENKQSQ